MTDRSISSATAEVTEFDPDALLTTDQAAKLINFTRRFLEARRLLGGGPPFVRVSRRAVRYRRRDLLSWVESLIRTSTSDKREEDYGSLGEAARRDRAILDAGRDHD